MTSNLRAAEVWGVQPGVFRLGCPDEGELNPLKHAHLNGEPEEEVAVLGDL